MKNQNASDKPASRPKKNQIAALNWLQIIAKLTVIEVINKERPIIMCRCSDIADTFDRKDFPGKSKARFSSVRDP